MLRIWVCDSFFGGGHRVGRQSALVPLAAEPDETLLEQGALGRVTGQAEGALVGPAGLVVAAEARSSSARVAW